MLRKTTSSFLSVLFIVITLLSTSTPIYNGVPVTQGQFPYLVYLMVDPGKNTTYACGGGFLNSRYVISAGHCSFGSTFQVIVGLIDVDPYHTSDVVDVVSVVRPSNFGQNGVFDYDDVAIFELARDVPEQEGRVQYLDVGLNAPPIGTELTIAGFGELGINIQTPMAHYGTVWVANNSVCNFASFRSQYSYCTYNAAQYSCPGDSGSPLVVKTPGSTRWTIVGLDSYGHTGSCGDKPPDTVVSKIEAMVAFIKQQTPLNQPNFVTVNYGTSSIDTTPGPSYNCLPCPR